MRPPKLIKPYVKTFARQSLNLPEASPFYVWCSPAKGAPQNECFAVVDSCVAKHGGRRILGWAIWERPGVYIEAEFHGRKHTGTQTDNIRKPLVKDKNVKELLRLSTEFFRLTNEGNLKHHFGEFVATNDMVANIKNRALLEQKIINRYGALVPESLAPPDGLPLVEHSP